MRGENQMFPSSMAALAASISMSESQPEAIPVAPGADGPEHRVVLGRVRGDEAAPARPSSRGPVTHVGKSLVRIARGLEQLVGMPPVQRLQRDMRAAERRAGGQGAWPGIEFGAEGEFGHW